MYMTPLQESPWAKMVSNGLKRRLAFATCITSSSLLAGQPAELGCAVICVPRRRHRAHGETSHCDTSSQHGGESVLKCTGSVYTVAASRRGSVAGEPGRPRPMFGFARCRS